MVTWLPPMLRSPARYERAPRETNGARVAFDAEVRSRGLRLLASGIPVRLPSWFPLDIAEGTVLEEDGPVIVGGVKSALAELGYAQTRTREQIIPSRLPTDAEAHALEISPERTVVEITHVGMTAEGRAVEVTVSVAPAHYVTAQYEFPLA
ncbi:UTRA domain-containing protein [Spirillospora sp. NPDC049024]